jgi:hypothetical protein
MRARATMATASGAPPPSSRTLATGGAVVADGAGDFAAAGGVADQHDLVQIKLLDERGEVVGVGARSSRRCHGAGREACQVPLRHVPVLVSPGRPCRFLPMAPGCCPRLAQRLPSSSTALPDLRRVGLTAHFGRFSVPWLRSAAWEPGASRREPTGTPTRRAVLKGPSCPVGCLPSPPLLACAKKMRLAAFNPAGGLCRVLRVRWPPRGRSRWRSCSCSRSTAPRPPRRYTG